MEFDLYKQTFFWIPMYDKDRDEEERKVITTSRTTGFDFCFLYDDTFYVFDRGEFQMIIGLGKVVVLDKNDKKIPINNKEVRDGLERTWGPLVFMEEAAKNPLHEIDLNKTEKDESFNKYKSGNHLIKALDGIL